MMNKDQIEDAMILHATAIEKLRSMNDLKRSIKKAPGEFVRKQAEKEFKVIEKEYQRVLIEIKSNETASLNRP